MAKQYFLTDEGLKKYEQELEHLKSVARKDVAEKIKVALSFGDLSENSEYDEAKNEQAKVEARIVELETMLVNAQVIDEDDITTDEVKVGAKVTVYDMEYKENLVYRIVGSTEADPKQGYISDESPVGRALIGKSVGDVVKVEAPAGEMSFKIVEISR